MKIRLLVALLFGVGLISNSSHAANEASDVSTNAAYSDGWQAGDNGGTGFGAWTQSGSTNGSNGGYFVGSSAGNGDGDGNADGDINVGGSALGIYANGGQSVSAVRPMTGGSLSVGQTFVIAFDNGWLDTGSSDGFTLESSAGTDRLSFFFTGGNATYELFDNSGFVNTGIGFSDEGLTVAVTMTGAETYSAVITSIGSGVSTNISGTFQNSGNGIDQVLVNNNNAGSGGNFDMFVNSMAVIPEPSTMALTSLGMLGLGVLRRRRLAK